MKTSSSSSIPGAGRAHEGITGRGFRTLLVSLGPCGARRPSSRMGQVIFVPDADAWGSPLTSFSFLASDGEADSSPATVTAHVVLPPRPSLMSAPSGITTNGAFSLSFTGSSNAAYRVWSRPTCWTGSRWAWPSLWATAGSSSWTPTPPTTRGDSTGREHRNWHRGPRRAEGGSQNYRC